MALKFGMKDISNPMFSDGDVTLNWLDYMNSINADILYPGPKVKRLFKESSLTGKYEIFYTTSNYFFIRNLSNNKEQIICRTSVKPPDFKTRTIEQIKESLERAGSVYDIPHISGVSNFKVTSTGVSFDVETKMFASEHSLVNLDPEFNNFDKDFRNLMIHAFIIKDIFIPIKARVYVRWDRNKPEVTHILNRNKHMSANCYGTTTADLENAIKHKEITRIAVLMLTAIGNINLADSILWGRESLFNSDSAIKHIIKNGTQHTLEKSNFKDICPEVKVDFNVVNSIIRRHQIT